MGDPSTIHLNSTIYKAGAPGNKQSLAKDTTVTLANSANVVIYGTSRMAQDCVIFKSGASNVGKMWQFNHDAATPSVTEVADLSAANQGGLDMTTSNVVVAAKCRAYAVGTKVYRKVASSSAPLTAKFVGDAVVFTDPVFDETLNYAIDAGEIYKDDGTTYTKILATYTADPATALLANNKIYYSEANNRLIIVTDDDADFSVRYFRLVGTTWTSVDVSMTGTVTTAADIPEVRYSPDWSIIGVGFVDNSGASQTIIKQIKADNTATANIELPDEITLTD